MDGIDVIVSWPRSCDYPLWRQFIRDERARFNRVYAVFTDHDGPDYSAWVRSNCPEIDFLDSLNRRRDWRDAAVNTALLQSTAERLWFTEQDFFITDPSFWEAEGQVIGFDAGDGRPLHPACIFVDRQMVNQTSRYFGPEPVDHFYSFGKELCALVRPALLTGGFSHMQGTSQNHYLIDKGEDVGVFKRDKFQNYLRDCLTAGVPLHSEWSERAEREIA